jgi:hypothetical protein
MTILVSVIQDELDRSLRTQAAYRRELSQYPQGSLVFKNRKSIRYVYLAYRDDSNRVKTDYIGNERNPKVKLLQQQIRKRKEIVLLLKQMEKDEIQMRKILKRSEVSSDK